MKKKKINPITPSQRQTILFDRANLTSNFRIKSLTKGFQRANGRNHKGRITVHHRGGGHKRLYRFITFNRYSQMGGLVMKLLYDPNRSANIAYIQNTFKSYFILAPKGIQVNQSIENSPTSDLTIGNALPLRNIPVGSLVHNINGQFIRSAGTVAQIIQKVNNKYAKIRMASGEVKYILLTCYATLGVVSNENHNKRNLGKAGRSRWLNLRPCVRGVAKNPVDHPHGGGEGKTSGGRPSVTPYGKLTKGKLTRKKKKLRIQ